MWEASEGSLENLASQPDLIALVFVTDLETVGGLETSLWNMEPVTFLVLGNLEN